MNRLFLFLLPLALIVSSCSAAPIKKKEVAPAALNVRKEFQLARTSFEKSFEKKQTKSAQAQQKKLALARLKKFVAANPNTDLTDDAHFMLGRLYADAGDYTDAKENYSDAAVEATDPNFGAEALVRAALSALRLGQFDQARAWLNQAEQTPSLTPEKHVEVAEVRLELAAQQKNNGEALAALAYIAQNHASQAKRDQALARGQTLIEGLGEDELKSLRDRQETGLFRAQLKFAYGELLAKKHDVSGAKKELQGVIAAASGSGAGTGTGSGLGSGLGSGPGSDLVARAQELLQQLDAAQTVNPRVIGAVLPLSGRQAAIGQKALRGIQIGLGIYGRAPSNFQLAVIDSAGSPDAGRLAVERLVVEDNAIAIIGGMMSKTASAEAQRAQELGVPFIALSQKAGLTQIGDDIFRNAVTSQMQMAKLVDIAMNQLKMQRFAILYPNDAYGTDYATNFWDEVKARGGQIVGAEVYDSKETDFRGPIQKLVGTFYLDDRADELRLKTKEWQEKNPKASARKSPPKPEDMLGPLVDFDAIFIPDSTRALGQIAPMLAYNDVDHARLLGTNLWNTADVAQRGQKYAEQAVFVDSFLLNDRTFTTSEFYTTFKSVFADDEPGALEVQGYDSALALRQVVASGETSRAGVAQALAHLRNFPGALGPLNMGETREMIRPVMGLTVQKGLITPL